MSQPFYQVDAFTDHIFGGNPAGVCPLEQWLPDAVMQNIAMENNVAETAFFVKEEDQFHLRWFTPVVEVDLCGHATLGASWVIFNKLGYSSNEIRFRSRSGWLTVTRSGDLLTLDFPADTIAPASPPAGLVAALGVNPIDVLKGKTDWMIVVETQKEVESLTPDMEALMKIPCRGVMVTAKGDSVDFVSRFFAPQSGVPEDPVTGSAHTSLTPYWAAKLGKSDLHAMQLSKRKGHLTLKLSGDRVFISGTAQLYLKGEIYF